jgi:tRNA (guanine10-N2)-dimethyltransferase
MAQPSKFTAKSRNSLSSNTKLRLYRGKLRHYLYVINFPVYEESLCMLEMKCLFGRAPEKKYFLSHHYVDPSRSVFIKQCLTIKYTGYTIEAIISQIVRDNLSYTKFKVSYIKHGDDSIDYNERLKAEDIIGLNIIGRPEIHNPEVTLGITKLKDKWLFGENEKNNLIWKSHDKKPCYYSNALGIRTARALVNIAAANNLNSRLVDPCCGIGTVVMEALSMGIDIKGYEINPSIAENARRNLEFFGYEHVIANRDMHTLSEKFDTAIVDLPYGLFNPTTLQEQVDIMKTARRIADKMVIITFENMDEHLASADFEIVDSCEVAKGRFVRYITVCK